MCRMSTSRNSSEAIVNDIPLGLRMWWNDLEESRRDTVKMYLGKLVGLLDIVPRGDIIRELISF